MSLSMHPGMYPAAGEVLDGKFEVRQMLGEGGMGAVAKGWDRELHRDVALKFMSPHLLMMPGAVERFLMEAQAAARVRNDHVVEFYSRGVLKNGTPFLVMEFLDGKDLAAIVEKEGIQSIPLARAVHFTLQVLRGLQVAHSLNVIHRDMKPSNCFVVHREGEDDFVKVVDFGISKIQDPSGAQSRPGGGAALTKTNSALGTPLYMSPEQAKSPRDVDHRSDLYSVAAILYELLTARTPHLSETGEYAEILVKLLTQQPTPLAELRPDLPPGLVAAVHKGLAHERDQRYRDALDFAEAIAPWADDRSAWVLRRLRSDRRNSQEIKEGDLPFMRTAAPGSIAPPANPGVATVKGYVPPAPSSPRAVTPVPASTPHPHAPAQAATPFPHAGPTPTPVPGSMSRGEMMASTVASDPPPRPSLSTSTSTAGEFSKDARPSGGMSQAVLGVIGFVVVLGAAGAYFGIKALSTGHSVPEGTASAIATPHVPETTTAIVAPPPSATASVSSASTTSTPSATVAPSAKASSSVAIVRPSHSATKPPASTLPPEGPSNPLNFKPL